MSWKGVSRLLISVVVCLVIGLSAVSAQGTAEKEEQITLKFASWMLAEASGGEKILPEKLKEWEAMHEGVTVEIVPLAWEDTPDKIVQQTIAKNMPDIFTIESLWLGKFESMPNCVEDLTPYLKGDPEFAAEIASAVDSGMMNGRMAALVWNPNPMFLVYNKRLAEQAGVSGNPTDLQDLLDQAQAISDLGDDVFGLGLQLGIDEYSADFFHIVSWMNNADMFNNDLQPVVNSPEMIETVNMVKRLVDTGVVPFGEEVRNLRTLFAQGKVGFFLEGPWITGVLDGMGMNSDDWGVVPVPGKSTPCSHFLAMSAQSEHKNLAWDLMKFITSDEELTSEYYLGTGLLPSIASYYEKDIYDNPAAKVSLEAMANLRNPNVWMLQKKTELEITCMQSIQSILLGMNSTEAELNALQMNLEEMIKE